MLQVMQHGKQKENWNFNSSMQQLVLISF